MIIKKSSWHYKFNCHMHNKHEVDRTSGICAYTWLTLISILGGILTPLILIGLTLVFASMMGVIAIDILDVQVSYYWSIPIGIASMLASLIGVIVLAYIMQGITWVLKKTGVTSAFKYIKNTLCIQVDFKD